MAIPVLGTRSVSVEGNQAVVVLEGWGARWIGCSTSATTTSFREQSLGGQVPHPRIPMTSPQEACRRNDLQCATWPAA